MTSPVSHAPFVAFWQTQLGENGAGGGLGGGEGD